MQQGIPSGWKSGSKRELVIGAIVVFVLICLGVVKIFITPSKPPPQTAARTQVEEIVSVAEEASTMMKAKQKTQAQKRQKALAAIAEHEAVMNLNWNDKDTPDRLMAVGNLHQYQLSDYYSAIQSYRSLVDAYPNHSQTPQAYVEIATCYERLGDEVQARYVYLEMIESLDPSLQHVAFAQKRVEEM